MRPQNVDKAWFQARLKQVGETQVALANHLKIQESAVSNILAHPSRRDVSAWELVEMARFLRVDPSTILKHLGLPSAYADRERIEVVGYVSAGDTVVLYEVADRDNPLEYIENPVPGYFGTVLQVKGDSMAPRYVDGEYIAYQGGDGDLAKLLGREVVCRTEDGRLLLKRIQKGSKPNVYTLLSINPIQPPLLDVALDWAAPIDWHKPR